MFGKVISEMLLFIKLVIVFEASGYGTFSFNLKGFDNLSFSNMLFQTTC